MHTQKERVFLALCFYKEFDWRVVILTAVHAGRVSSLKEDIYGATVDSACADSRPAFLTLLGKHTHIWTTHFILTQTEKERKRSFLQI